LYVNVKSVTFAAMQLLSGELVQKSASFVSAERVSLSISF
jgi:hypothetical protein